jgi:hypothetical protein
VPVSAVFDDMTSIASLLDRLSSRP